MLQYYFVYTFNIFSIFYALFTHNMFHLYLGRIMSSEFRSWKLFFFCTVSFLLYICFTNISRSQAGRYYMYIKIFIYKALVGILIPGINIYRCVLLNFFYVLLCARWNCEKKKAQSKIFASTLRNFTGFVRSRRIGSVILS